MSHRAQIKALPQNKYKSFHSRYCKVLREWQQIICIKALSASQAGAFKINIAQKFFFRRHQSTEKVVSFKTSKLFQDGERVYVGNKLINLSSRLL